MAEHEPEPEPEPKPAFFIKHSDETRSRSKAQSSLQKIIDFITLSSSRSSLEVCNQSSEAVKAEAEIDIDLNLRLGPHKELESACSGVGDADVIVKTDVWTVEGKSSEGECSGVKEVVANYSPANDAGQTEVVVEDEVRDRELSAITNAQVESSGIGDTNNTKCRRSNGYLDLLVEAAIFVSGDFEDQDGEEKEKQEPKKKKQNGKREKEKEKETRKVPTETQTKPNESIPSELKRNNEGWMIEFYQDFEDVSPIVRSKRGRNQVLPSKYKDTVLEPWKPLSRQRSSKQRINK